MKPSLLLFLALPLPAVAQYSVSNTGPSMRQATAQHTRMSAEFERDAFEKQERLRRLSAQQPQVPAQQSEVPWEQAQAEREQQVAQQRRAEQRALDGLGAYAHYQDSMRQAHPAPTARLEAAWQQQDAQRLALLTVRAYRDVFLPGQVLYASQTRSLAPEVWQKWHRITNDLLDNAWWSQQDPALLLAKIKTYRSTLTALTTEMLGFDPATAPKFARMPSTGPLDALRAKGTFDSEAATQYMQETARAEKVNYSQQLVSALNDFNRHVAEAAARPEYQQNPQKMRKAVKAGLQEVDDAMGRYELLITQSKLLGYAQAVVHKYATTCLSQIEKDAMKPAD